MKKFMQTHQVYLTPLSPIHIGCGEDFEPTNYIVNNEQDKNLLYYFDPSKLFITTDSEEFREFCRYAKTGAYEEVKKFFIRNKDYILEKNISSYQTLVPQVFQEEWETKEIIKNKLEIERNAYLTYPFNQPYIPGSSFKGALATAILDFEHNKNPQVKKGVKHSDLLDKYIGNFKDSKLRCIKFSDFLPTHSNVISQVFYAKNFEKFEEDEGGLSVRREAILDKQYRAYQTDLVITENQNFKFEYSKQDIVKILNSYYISVFKKEMSLLIKRNLVSQDWFNNVLTLISSSDIALIRLGKNGSDSKVYQDKSITNIKTKKEEIEVESFNGKKRKKAIFENLSESTTIWLAQAENSSKGQLAFGWALLEFDVKNENSELLKWCGSKEQKKFNRNAFLATQKIKLIEREKQIAQLKAEEEAKHLAKKQAQEAEANRLNSLSENQRLIEEKVAEWEKMEVKAFNANPNVFGQAKAFLQEVHNLDWNKEDRQYLYEILDPMDKSKIIYRKNTGIDNFNKLSAKSAVEFKKLRNKLVAE